MKNATVTSTIRLTGEQLKYLKTVLKKIFKEDIEIKNVLDGEILGGFTLRVNDWYLDASIKSDLKILTDSII